MLLIGTVWTPPMCHPNPDGIGWARNQELESKNSPSGGWNSVRQKFPKLALVRFLSWHFPSIICMGVIKFEMCHSLQPSFACSPDNCWVGFQKCKELRLRGIFDFGPPLSISSASFTEIGRATSDTQRRKQAGEWRLSQEKMLSFNFHEICIYLVVGLIENDQFD